MIRVLLTTLILLFLTGCLRSHVRDDKPASDLDALLAGVTQSAKPRLLPNGKLYCAEEAKLRGQMDACTLDLEDSLFLAEGDKVQMLEKVTRAVARMKLAHNPCSFWEKLTRNERCYVPND